MPSLCNPLGSGLTGQSGIGLGTTTKPFLSQLDGKVGLGSEGVGLTGKGCFLPTWIADFNKTGQMVESDPTMQMTEQCSRETGSLSEDQQKKSLSLES